MLDRTRVPAAPLRDKAYPLVYATRGHPSFPIVAAGALQTPRIGDAIAGVVVYVDAGKLPCSTARNAQKRLEVLRDRVIAQPLYARPTYLPDL